MEIISQVKTLDSLLKLLWGDRKKAAPYPFIPEKQKYKIGPEKFPLPVSSPEKQGIPSEHLLHFLEDLDNCKEIQAHSLIVLRHGTVILHADWKPYSGVYPHMMYSLSKSITGMAVGLAIAEGLFQLEDRIIEFFPEKLPLIRNPRINNLRIKHLLTMTSGIKFNEMGSLTERDWVRAFFQSECAFEPGSKFAYNSMNSYLLSALVCKKTGLSLVEYLTPRLFEPLGIGPVFWEKCPLGIEKGGWGLYLRPIEMAKLGQLFLQKGAWNVNGHMQQILPQSWVEQSVNMEIPAKMGQYDAHYGYQLWSFPIDGAFQFNGAFGQYVIVLPQTDMVIAMTGGSECLFLDPSCRIIQQYFSGSALKKFTASSQHENFAMFRALQKKSRELYLFPETRTKLRQKGIFSKIRDLLYKKDAASLPPKVQELSGRIYEMEKSYGTLMPFILQGVRNLFTDGITQVKFSFTEQDCLITFYEEDEIYRMKAGYSGHFFQNTLCIHGEIYEVGATALLTYDEDERTVLKLFLSFLETPNTRRLKFIFYGNRIIVRFDESPSALAAAGLLCGLVASDSNVLQKVMFEVAKQQGVEERLESMAKPRVKGKWIEI